MTACIPDGMKGKMNTAMKQAQEMLADQEFKKAIAQIELHKLRNGNYPASLSELEFLTQIDSSFFSVVAYTRLDSGYELNLEMRSASFTNDTTGSVDLHYPPEFWKGLGCVKSNAR
jgi:hypothetical protein